MGADTLFDQQGSLSPNQGKYLTLAPGAEDQRNYNTRIVDNFSSLDNTLPKLAWDLMLYIDVANPETINISAISNFWHWPETPSSKRSFVRSDSIDQERSDRQ
jgi:hypothetical protein